MEISSMGSMQQGMSMDGRRRPPGDPAEDVEKMSNEVMEQQDADEDGLLTVEELDGDSDLLAKLDEDGDGVLSQTELQTGLHNSMESAKAAIESGNAPSDEDRELMQQMHALVGDSMEPPDKAAQAYTMTQDSTTDSSMEVSSYNTDQMLIDSLSLTV